MVGTCEITSVVLKLYVFFKKNNGMPVHPMKTPNGAVIDRIETGRLPPISDPVDYRTMCGLFVWLW